MKNKKTIITTISILILSLLFFSNYKISKFNYTGQLQDLNGQNWYTYKDNNGINHLDKTKSDFKIIVIDKESYYNN
jgi:hypothetical protein